MSDYKLYGFNDSGHSYKVALMLELLGVNWQVVEVDFFKGATRTEAYRTEVNEMGEVPVLVDGDLKLSQSGVILDYLAKKHNQFGATNEVEAREILRWVLYDNHKVSSQVGVYRFMKHIKKFPDNAVTDFLNGRILDALSVMDKHLVGKDWFVANRPTIADFSLCSYLYFADEIALDLTKFPEVTRWLNNIKALKGWQHSYDLLPTAEK